jgi:thioredoxin 1
MRDAQTTTDSIATISGTTFSSMVLEATGPIVVEFMSYGCSHCRALEPVIQHVAASRQGKERFLRVNVAIEPDLVERYAITGTPTLVMFRDGNVVGRAEGPHPAESTIVKLLAEAFEG